MVEIHLSIKDVKWLLNGKSISDEKKGYVIFPPKELRELPWEGRSASVYISALVDLEEALDQIKKVM